MTINYINNYFEYLPYSIQLMIINNMNYIEAKLISKKCPYIINLINNIKWHNINYTDIEKNNMLIMAFNSFDIDIIESLFDTINYFDINKIYINNDTFYKIIEICYNNNFIKGIEYLVNIKTAHFNNFKDYTNNNYNQFELVSDYIKNNSAEPLKILIQLIIQNNNNSLFDYIIYKYSSSLVTNFNDYKNLLFSNYNSDMLSKVINSLKSNCCNTAKFNYYISSLEKIANKYNINLVY